MPLKSVIKMLILFLTGGLIYFALEMLFRGRSHWTMIVVGGICFLICGGINEIFTWEMPLIWQGIISALIITIIELIAGCIINIQMNLNVWDYSDLPFNLYGQICLLFSLLWGLLGMVAVVVDDYLRYYFWKEKKPYYKII